jgi:hypothetical protein
VHPAVSPEALRTLAADEQEYSEPPVGERRLMSAAAVVRACASDASRLVPTGRLLNVV